MNKTKEFIKKSKKVHGKKYNYSLVEYVNSHTKVKIICVKHGVFEQTPNNHINNHGCNKCGRNKTVEAHKITFKNFKERANKIHNEIYFYPEQEMNKNYEKINIICDKHGEFFQIISDHLRGRGCPKCGIESRTNISKSNTENFIKKSKEVHGDKYDYSKSIYIKAFENITIICPVHGEFIQKANSHLNGRGCPVCCETKGERVIKELLNKKGIIFEQQKTFSKCKYIKLLPFDFYLPDYNICIEYDGIQHFKPIKYWKGEEGLKIIQIRDKIKTDFCKENNIQLLRIKYNQKIKNILERFFLKSGLSYT